MMNSNLFFFPFQVRNIQHVFYDWPLLFHEKKHAWLAFKKRTEFSNSKQQLSVQQQQRAGLHSAVYGNFRENIGLLWSE